MKNLFWTILAATFASALPLACSDDDSSSEPNGAEAGASAGGEVAAGGNGKAGESAGGNGGADAAAGNGGADAAAGNGGEVSETGGAGGETGGNVAGADAGGADAAGGSGGAEAAAGSGGATAEEGNGGAGGELGAQFELVGNFSSIWGSESITETTWAAGTFVQNVVSYDNAANYSITMLVSDGKFSKIIWTEPSGGSFSYCTVVYGQATAQAAEASTNTADANDLASGCAGFPWTTLTAQ